MIRVAQVGATCTLTLDRPEKANALDGAMLQALIDGVDEARTAGARVLVLTGTGRVFSAGADLDAARPGLATSPLWEALSARIASFAGLSIAALNGTVAGGACGMVLACDLRIAPRKAKLFYPVMKLGFLPQPSDPARLVALVGPARAKLILMAGLKVSADEAQGWGLIDRICDDDGLDAMVQEVSADVLAAPDGHVAAIKRLIPAYSAVPKGAV